MPDPTPATLHVAVKNHEKRLDGHDDEFIRHTDWIAKVQNRPPVWMGMIVTVLTGLLCTLAGAAAAAAFILIGN